MSPPILSAVSGAEPAEPAHRAVSGTSGTQTLIHDFIHCGFFITGAGHYVFIVRGDIHREYGGGLVGLEDGGSVGSSPGVQQVVLSCRDEPLAAVSELERENTALVEVELVFVGLGRMENLNVGVLHSDRQPVPSRTIS